jgi:hypothetical protein
MTERRTMYKPSRSFARPLRDLVGKVVGETFTRHGFASAELVTRWTEIVGAEIAAHSEPIKIQWVRPVSASRVSPANGAGAGWDQEAGTLVLRVEGPAAIEVQHLAGVICERVNRFLGWRAIARVALRQAPLRRGERKAARDLDPVAAERVAESLSDIGDQDLRQALARLGAAVKRG